MMRKSSCDLACEYIKEGIMEHRYQPGDPINEIETASALNISRAPVREALNRLEAEGVVVKYSGRGCFVNQMTEADFDMIIDMRILLETSAVKQAIRVLPEAKIREVLDEVLLLDENTPEQEFLKSNERVHRLIIDHSQSQRIKRFYDNISFQIGLISRMPFSVSDHHITSNKEHAEILEAMIARDAETACRIITRHLGRIKQEVARGYGTLT